MDITFPPRKFIFKNLEGGHYVMDAQSSGSLIKRIPGMSETSDFISIASSIGFIEYEKMGARMEREYREWCEED